MNVDKSNILDKIIKKVDCIIEKMDKQFYKKWKSKFNQKNILNVLNDVDFNDCVYIENKNNYLICEFEKCPDIQKNELIKEFEKLLPLTQRQKRERVKNGISEKEPRIEVKKRTNKFLEFCKENRDVVKRDIPNIKPREVYSELARRWKDYRFVEDTRREDGTESDTRTDGGGEPKIGRPTVGLKVFSQPPSDTERKDVDVVDAGRREVDDCKVKKRQRRLSGYIIFCNENRPFVKQKFPNMKPQRVMKELAKQWRNLNDETRSIYNYESTASQRAENRSTAKQLAAPQ